MAISNARNWVDICEHQLAIFDKLAEQFPERRDSLNELSQHWRHVQSQLKQGQQPVFGPLK